METPLYEPFFTRKMRTLSKPDDFLLYGTLSVDFLSTSALLYPNMKVELRLIGAKSLFLHD